MLFAISMKYHSSQKLSQMQYFCSKQIGCKISLRMQHTILARVRHTERLTLYSENQIKGLFYKWYTR